MTTTTETTTTPTTTGAMAMSAPGDWMRIETPYRWVGKQAVTLFDVLASIDRHLDPAVPLSRETMALVFFHESAFSNFRQKTSPTKQNTEGLGPRVGLGQMAVLEGDKPAFFRSAMGVVPSPELFDLMTGDPDFAIKAQCLYVGEAFRRGAATTRALVAIQLGGPGSESLVDHVMAAEPLLKAALATGEQRPIVDALNACRWYGKRDRRGFPIIVESKAVPVHLPIPPEGRFQRYWDFTVPVPGDAAAAEATT